MDKKPQPESPRNDDGGLGRNLLHDQQVSADISNMDQQEGNMEHGETGDSQQTRPGETEEN